MDREAKALLAEELRRRAASGQAVIVATHDPEFAAACATRAVLMADGRVIADGRASELLAGGWYFATETARILGRRRRGAAAAGGSLAAAADAGRADPSDLRPQDAERPTRAELAPAAASIVPGAAQ